MSGFKYKPVYKARDLLHKFKRCQEKIEKKSKNSLGRDVKSKQIFKIRHGQIDDMPRS